MIAAAIRNIVWDDHDYSVILPNETVIVSGYEDEKIKNQDEYLNFIHWYLEDKYKCKVKDYILMLN